MSKNKPDNRYTVRKSGVDLYTLLEDGFFVEEYALRNVAERRAKLLNMTTVPGWKNRPVFVGADEEEEV